MTTHARTTPPSTELDLPLLPKKYGWRIGTYVRHYNTETGETIYRPEVELWHRGLFGWKIVDSGVADPYDETQQEVLEYTARRIANDRRLTPATPIPDEIAQYIGTYARKEN